MLAGNLREEGERILAPLGLAAIIIATVLFVINAQFVYVNVEMFQQKQATGKTPDWYTIVKAYFQPLVLLGGLLTYVATAVYATALGRIGWLGRLSSRLVTGISAVAAILVFLYSFGGKIGTPGFILLIPALPYLMPYFMGVLLVMRASQVVIGPVTAGETSRQPSA